MGYKREFPKAYWLPRTLTEVFAELGFADVSWHNDVCPRFERRGMSEADDLGAGVAVWCNEKNAPAREMGGVRYIVSRLAAEEDPAMEKLNGWFPGTLFECESTDDLIAFLRDDVRMLAAMFRSGMFAEMNDYGNLDDKTAQAKLRAIDEANRTAPEGCCCTHDVCDANIVMHDAWLALFRSDPLPSGDDDGGMSDASVALWNEAWEMAKAQGFADPRYAEVAGKNAMTFEAFRATARAVDDLGAALGDESLEGTPGRIYCDTLFIGDISNCPPDAPGFGMGKWWTIDGRTEHQSDDLEAIERELYKIAASLGYFD